MGTSRHQIVVSGIAVEIVRKTIKNLHLGVYPPDGRVRVAVPLAVSDEAVRLAVVGKLAWIKRQRATFAAQPRQPARRMVSGETHYVMGRAYRLRVVALEPHHRAKVVLASRSWLELHVPPDTDPEYRRQVLNRWYRRGLRERIPALLAKWQPVIGVAAAAWGIRKMKTKWGSCNPAARRIWLNLELAKKPPECLEYIVVHELVHLLERRHGARFAAFMNQSLPHWRLCRDELNRAPLAHEEWQY